MENISNIYIFKKIYYETTFKDLTNDIMYHKRYYFLVYICSKLTSREALTNGGSKPKQNVWTDD